MGDPYLPEGWTQDKIDDAYARQAREHDTLEDRRARHAVTAAPPPSPYADDIEPKPCRSCESPMLWVRTETGKTMPLNPTPDVNGNIVFTGPGQVRYLKRGDVTPYPTPRYTSHFSDCPEAARFRKA